MLEGRNILLGITGSIAAYKSPDIARRIYNAKSEITGYADYDYVVVNDKLDKAYRELESIIISSRLEMGKADHAWIQSLVT